jgi:hypothetical protein
MIDWDMPSCAIHDRLPDYLLTIDTLWLIDKHAASRLNNAGFETLRDLRSAGDAELLVIVGKRKLLRKIRGLLDKPL